MIESRNLSTGLAKRTIKNLRFIYAAHEHGLDVHVVTQVINSLLSLLVFPLEKEAAFFDSFTSVALGDPPDFSMVTIALPGFPSLPSLQVREFGACKNVKRFLKRLRNAVSHRRIEFSSESHDLAAVTLCLTDALPNQPIDWDISLSAFDLLQLSAFTSPVRSSTGICERFS